jgi:hypothetical protein
MNKVRSVEGNGTHVSSGPLARVKYFSHCLIQFTGSSPAKVVKSSLGLAMERLNWLGWWCCLLWSGWLC